MTLKNLYITKFLLFLPSLKAKNLKENPTPKEIQFFHKISSQAFSSKDIFNSLHVIFGSIFDNYYVRGMS